MCVLVGKRTKCQNLDLFSNLKIQQQKTAFNSYETTTITQGAGVVSYRLAKRSSI
ncbi:MAG: hypothetical protein LBC74_15300 [Planctomycetaceae bacterium]|nr:hypothetical protein [Planctomycetaceae bacterium]